MSSSPAPAPQSYYQPGPAEILRATQKDGVYIQGLQSDILEWILLVKGQRTWLKMRNWAESFASLLYYTLTTLSGSQTLGEEYTGILPVVSRSPAAPSFSENFKVPSKKILLGMILIQIFGDRILTEGKKILIKKLESRFPDKTNETKTFLIRIGYLLNLLIPLTTRFHQVLFFLQGKYYHLAKRILGVQYILVRKWYANRASVKYLVWLSFLNFGLSGLSTLVTYYQQQQSQPVEQLQNTSNTGTIIDNNKESSDDEEDEGSLDPETRENRKCSLCLEIRKSPSLTPCGHLFCWACIIDWLQTSANCPICREALLPNHVVPLQNYA